MIRTPPPVEETPAQGQKFSSKPSSESNKPTATPTPAQPTGAPPLSQPPQQEQPFCDQKVHQLEQQIIELTDLLKRVQAEYINYKNRTERDREHVKEQANKNLISDLISILDVFELALGAISHQKESSHTFQGFEMVHTHLLDMLKKYGLSIIDQIGIPLDRSIHEPLKTIAGETPNIVVEVLQKGYRLHRYVLRPAKVGITISPSSGNTQHTPDKK